jgi:hypothetical protein
MTTPLDCARTAPVATSTVVHDPSRLLAAMRGDAHMGLAAVAIAPYRSCLGLYAANAVFGSLFFVHGRSMVYESARRSSLCPGWKWLPFLGCWRVYWRVLQPKLGRACQELARDDVTFPSTGSTAHMPSFLSPRCRRAGYLHR